MFSDVLTINDWNLSFLLKRQKNLNGLLRVASEQLDNIILLISGCDECSKLWKNIKVPKILYDKMGPMPEYREGLIFIADSKNNYYRYETGSELCIDYSNVESEIALKVESKGYINAETRGISSFDIMGFKYSTRRRGINIIILSNNGAILDCVNVDTHGDLELTLQR